MPLQSQLTEKAVTKNSSAVVIKTTTTGICYEPVSINKDPRWRKENAERKFAAWVLRIRKEQRPTFD